VLPESAYVITSARERWPSKPQDLSIGFEHGVPATLDGEKFDPVRLIERLNQTGGAYGVGRGMHVGDTILGIKGRVAFEAPAAVTLIAAHRELEKLVLSRQQLLWKRTLGDLYGSFMHEARYFDPLMRDIEAFLESSQRRVTGVVTVRLLAGQATMLGATSPYSLMNPAVGLYGESSKLWDGDEAAAFVKLYGLQDQLLHAIGAKGEADAACG
jgi:argininosuccinate synthase